MARLYLYLLFFLVPVSILSGGALLTSGGEVEVGEMTDTGEEVKIKIAYGSMAYPKSELRWFHVHPRIKAFYHAGVVAMRQGKPLIAEIFFRASFEGEKEYRDRAQKALAHIEEQRLRQPESDGRDIPQGPSVADTASSPPGWQVDAGLKEDERIAAEPGVSYYHSDEGDYAEGEFAVFIPRRYTPETAMPLVVSSHGAGGTGRGEIGGWKAHAEKYGFIVVCPSYGCAAKGGSNNSVKNRIDDDDKMLEDIMKRVFGSLNIDRGHVLHTGFSGGGIPTWYIAMAHPEWFTALCFRSANFFGERRYKLKNEHKWRDRPIYIFWGAKDHPLIIKHSPVIDEPEGPAALEFLQKDVRCTRLKHEIHGGGHAGRPDLAARWFAEEVVRLKTSAAKK